MPYKPVVLAIFDGWGVAPDSEGNAITRARLTNFNNYLKHYPSMTLFASGNEVGLMSGEMGNSEVGHLNIGAGRVYYQSLPRIDQEIVNRNFFKNHALVEAVNKVKKNGSALHLVGLLGSGNVHASDKHLNALLELCHEQGLENKVFVHGILDGRDIIYNSGLGFVKELEAKMTEFKLGKIATLSGRYYAMDRDNRWDRVEKAFKVMVQGTGNMAENAVQAVEDSYAKSVYDEEFIPTVILNKGQPVATVKDGDVVIFFNFRPDRARELTKAFVLPVFDAFERGEYMKDLLFVTMTEFEKDVPAVVAYPPVIVTNCLAEVISKAGLKQMHIAETEKYAHITFFLNGTIEDPFPGEDRGLIPSPKVASYAEAPEMSAALVAKDAIKAIESSKYEFIALNFANPDMVGHTGNLEATIKGCEAADKAFGEIVEHTLAQGGVVVMTADHGNAEEVINLQTGAMDKEHSTNAVPLIIIGKDFMGQAGAGGDAPEGDLSLLAPVGMLADVAPTVLKLLGIDQPIDMTGSALI